MFLSSLARRAFASVGFAVLLLACASAPPQQRPRPAPSHAKPPGEAAAFTEVEQALAQRYGAGTSGFELLHVNGDALRVRLAAIDAARESIDLQYYLWYSDSVGRIVLAHVADAARRGVHVRILVDDLLMIGQDELLVLLDESRNIELRLFNPWDGKLRSPFGRAVQFVTDTARLNHRMHNKLLIVDSQLAIVGGRNLGDEYFGLNERFNFLDMDLLAVGPAAREVEQIFDHFFNSRWVESGAKLGESPTPEWAAELEQRVRQRIAEDPKLRDFPGGADDVTDWKRGLPDQLVPGRARAIFDHLPDEGMQPGSEGTQQLLTEMGNAKSQVWAINAYVIPPDPSPRLQVLQDRAVDVRLLTNSLGSHDVPAVNSAFKKKRNLLLGYGVHLYELRHDAAIKSVQDTPPVDSEFLGLHAKCMMIDREKVFVGSLNLDGRSMNLNTEMGLMVESPPLAEKLAAYMEEDMSPENAWHVTADEHGDLLWTSYAGTVSRQPARNVGQRVADWLFGLLPIEDQL